MYLMMMGRVLSMLGNNKAEKNNDFIDYFLYDCYDIS